MYITLYILFISFVLLFIIRDILYRFVKKNTEKNLLHIETIIENSQWIFYRYIFLKKLIYIDYFYNEKYKTNEDLVSIVKEHPIFKENRGYTYYCFFDDEKVNNILNIIEENKEFFNNIHLNDDIVINYNNQIDELTSLHSKIKKYKNKL